MVRQAVVSGQMPDSKPDGVHSLSGGLTIRRASQADDAEVVNLLSSTLGWRDDDRHRQLFHWKHRANPFGDSPSWVAVDEDGIAGFRTFMRWEFRLGDEIVRTVRAVDTATHPRAQGRGIFRALTMQAVHDTTAEGVAWAFNTPNDRSYPGYISMGWQDVGRLSIGIRPAGFGDVPRMLRSKQPADLWSLPTTVGEDPSALLADTSAIRTLLASSVRAGDGLRTKVDEHYLAWRYGLSPIGYRLVPVGRDITCGLIVFRLRRRGRLTEVLIADAIRPRDASAGAFRKALGRLVRACRADYAVTIGALDGGWIPLRGAGPRLTWRKLGWSQTKPELKRWGLVAGDVELF